MIGLLSQEKDSFKKEQARNIANYGEWTKKYLLFSTLTDFII